MWLQVKNVMLTFGVVTFLVGLTYVISYYVRNKDTTVEECQTQHRTQAWVTFSLGLVLMIVGGIMSYFSGRGYARY